MPSGFAALDTGFPNLSGYNSTEEKLKAMEDYLVQLLEQLRYTLHNIGVENMNTPEVTGWLGEVITEPIQAEIIDVENGLSTRINANAEAITAEVTRATGAEGTLGSRITQTAEAITAEVTRATGAESVIQQSADAIKAQVTDGQGNYTVLTLKSDGLHIGNATGTTTISGGCITTGTVTATQIAASAITADKIAANAVTAEKVNAGAVTTDKLAANAVTTAKLAAGAVTADTIAANAVTTAKIATGAVTANEIAANTITAAKIATGTITATQIAARTITAAEIATATITANEIAANTITASEIAANAITSAKIAANAITAGKIAANALNGYDIYGAKYHDLDGDSTLDIESFSGFTALMYGPPSMQNITDAVLGAYSFGSNHVGHFYIGGTKILTAGGSNGQATITQNMWNFGNNGIAVPYGTSDPGYYTPGYGQQGALYFKI